MATPFKTAPSSHTSGTTGTSSTKKIQVLLLVTVDSVYVPLAMVETMQCIDDVDEEVAVVNRLKEDRWINIRTHSGQEHIVSLKMIKEKVKSEKSVEEVWIDIVEYWATVINEKRK